MKKYKVYIHLIRGYYKDEEGNDDYENPNCEIKQFEVEAENEAQAIQKAMQLETSKYSIYESYADEIDND